MKKGLLFLLLLCLTINIEAQSNPLSLPLGIDVSGVGTGVVREHSTNADANRFMEKTIKEDPDNLEKIEKLLNAGASAFVSYEMIDKKQYKLMDLMYKKNPKLIRYSQMLHYACANCTDTAMIDFLISHGASLDLCGGYYERYHDSSYGELCRKPYGWNLDRYYFTPQDVAYRQGNTTILNYIIKKYGKFPTTIGIADYIYKTLANDKKVEHLINLLNGEDNFYNLITKGKGNNDQALTELLNTNLPNGSSQFGYSHILCRAIERLGVYRNNGNTDKAAQYETLVRLMIDKGANVNITDEIVSVFVCPRNNSASFNSPIFAAMKYHNMMDIVKLLRTKGAPLKVQYKNYCEIKWKDIEGEAILDEYKEAILLGEL